MFLTASIGEGTQLRLLDTTTDIVKFSCRIFMKLLSIVNQYELNFLVHIYLQLKSYYFILFRRNEPGVQKSQILRMIQFQPCNLFDQITSAIRIYFYFFNHFRFI